MKQTQTLSDIATVLREIDKGKQWEFLTRQGNWTTPLINASPLYYLQNAHAIRIKPAELDADGWIPWSGGECPVPSGTSVEVRFPDDDTDIQIACKFRWKHSWNPPMGGDIIAYRLHKPEPEQQFDPHPNRAEVEAGIAQGMKWQFRHKNSPSEHWRNGISPHPAWFANVEYRLAPEPEYIPLGPDDVPPGSVLRSSYWNYGEHVTPSVFPGVVCWANTSGNVCLTYADLSKHDWQINRSLPLTGKWDPTAWEPCKKLKPSSTQS